MSDAPYFNRELSLLDFQERVLAIAENPNVPLLERVKFLAIVGSNLDEFFQVRVAGIHAQATAGVRRRTADGRTPYEQLSEIRPKCVRLLERAERLLAHELIPDLTYHGIDLFGWADLDDDDREVLTARFEQDIYPMLTPLAFDPAHPFPFISNLSLNLAVEISNPKTGAGQFARIKMPPLLPRFLRVGDRERFVPVESVVAAHLASLFPGMEILGHYPFRVTRSADQALEEEEAEDLLEAMEELLHARHRFSRAVRLEIDRSMPDEVRDLLVKQMQLSDDLVYVHHGLLAHGGLWGVYGLDRPELKDEPWIPPTQPSLADLDRPRELFDRIRENDVLVHLPYDAFGTSVGAFIGAAAADPAVVAIKQTLYRTSDPDDPAIGGELSIVDALMKAARSGKQVVVLVELKARFDEEANINWARLLEEAGVHVVYGVTGLKTHAKIALVVRREGDRLVRYSHIGTGNYNPKTARIYEDLGLLTTNPELGADLGELFNVLTGYSRQKKYRKVLVAPTTLRRDLRKLIREETERGPEGRILWKLNHLIDPKTIDLLYEASGAGVPIDLVVRGVCGIRPGIEGFSETIRVRSVVGKYLEHSRILKFGDGERARYLIGSADMMQRNLNGRVEALTPIEDPRLKARLEEILQIALADDLLAWELHGDGSWTKVPTSRGLNTHLRLESLALARAGGAGPDPSRAAGTDDIVIAGGGIVHRQLDDRTEVLLIHRPRYDDWSFPKGKLAAGEDQVSAALREVEEETGLRCSLGPEVGAIEYVDRHGHRKVVRYWAMPAGEGEFAPNDEVDEIRWMEVEQALTTLTYDRDAALLRTFADTGLR